MHTNFLLLIILPLCCDRVGLHTGLSKHLIICTAFKIQMNSKIFLCLEHHKLLTWLILVPVKYFSGSDKNYQLDVWKQWFGFCLLLVFLGMLMGTLILFMQQKDYCPIWEFWDLFFPLISEQAFRKIHCQCWRCCCDSCLFIHIFQ